MANKADSKEQKQVAVSLAILEVIERDGLNGVTHSKVSRKSGVSRAWIYEYIGKEKSDLIEYAGEVFTSFFARTKKADRPKTRAELMQRLEEGTEFVFQAVQANPVIIKLHYRFRGTDTAIGKVIAKYEKYWIGNTSKSLVEILGMSGAEASAFAEMIMVLRLGFAFRVVTEVKAGSHLSESKLAMGLLFRAHFGR
ncbi:TetR/AcrR family transcriptional regulator [Bdellovibrio sp. HCB185ZH]|uniref:TetR/AcrR family transcriptional regulator n=1 Tax=Bdellovibrio sp. HCB185ZH TaxID=3394235 RepID=UPI0039A68BDB